MGAVGVWVCDDRGAEVLVFEVIDEEMLRVTEEEETVVKQGVVWAGYLFGDAESLALTLAGSEYENDVHQIQAALQGWDGEPAAQPLAAEKGALAAVEDEDGG